MINKNKGVIIKEKTTRERQPQSKEERAEATSKGFKKKTKTEQLNRNERRKMTWKQSSGALYRAELDNQPMLEGFVGPMWDGGKLRYETPEIYNRLCE